MNAPTPPALLASITPSAAPGGDGTGTTAMRFRIGTRSLPALADHAFQGMTVLPGALLVALALRAEQAAGRPVPSQVRDVRFVEPVVLGSDDADLVVVVRERGDGRADYAFHEASGAQGAASARVAATLTVLRDAAPDTVPGAEHWPRAAFQAQADTALAGEAFYAALRANGNEYGERFRNVAALWRAGARVLARIPPRPAAGGEAAPAFDFLLLDALTQVLAQFVADRGATVVLRGLEALDVPGAAPRGDVWVQATLRPAAGAAAGVLVGDVQACDERGPWARLAGVQFGLLERPRSAEPAAPRLAIAANFTAEPLEDALAFWGDRFAAPMRVAFAPYNQVFQQLLDPASLLRRNADGANVVLLALDEWASAPAPRVPDPACAERAFAGHARRVLPNGMPVAELNAYETDYVYREIFEDGCYVRHGILLPDDATVVDVGANIGLFTLYVLARCARPRIVACEPAPAAFAVLKANCEAYGGDVRPLDVGVADRRGTATFTFYGRSSVFSGFHADEAEDRAAIRAVVRNVVEGAGADAPEAVVDELTADRLERRTCECRRVAVSDLIREQGLDRIDLLKIDAEKSEEEVLAGIGDDDWPRIRQVVLEIHDASGGVADRVEAGLVRRGFRCAREQEALLERSGLVNLYATRESPGAADAAAEACADAELDRNVAEFRSALRTFAGASKVPLVLAFTARSPAAQGDPRRRAALDAAEATLLADAAALPGVRTIASATLGRRYPVRDAFDAEGRRVAHIPYTLAAYAAIATAVYREVVNARREPFKVVALDCDNTLWKGVCGEDGPLGVELTPGHRALQAFMVARAEAGMLLCLCSKNNEQDALDVFAQRGDMPLRREHLVAWRLDWRPKSENLRALARELNLGLDSFVFLDDNPVECAEVRANCPGVLALQLPSDPAAIPAFLDHVWALDAKPATVEDRDRTRMYQQEAERERYRGQALSLQDFVEGLALDVQAAPVDEAQVARVSQLTFRTNQFNFTTIRRTEGEIRAFVAQPGQRGLAVRVVDRFGDYGLTGVLLYRVLDDRYEVDTFLLSCRVLGRGVEHALVARLGRQAVDEGKAVVAFRYARSAKNQPALDFIRAIAAAYAGPGETLFVVPAPVLAAVAYVPAAQPADEADGGEAAAPASRLDAAAGVARSERYQRIATELRDAGRIAAAGEAFRSRCTPAAPATPPAGTGLEPALAAIWRTVLGRPQLGLDENFFDAGGTSLRAVQVIAAIQRELGRTMSIVTLFECPTVRKLAARLGASEASPANAAAAAVERGRQRRQAALRRGTP